MCYLLPQVATMEDFTTSCRFCLEVVGEFAVDIFKDDNGRNLAKDVLGFIPYKLPDIDNWPRRACLDCIEFLQEIVKFHKRSIQSIRTLQKSVGGHLAVQATGVHKPIPNGQKGEKKLPSRLNGESINQPKDQTTVESANGEELRIPAITISNEVISLDDSDDDSPPPPIDSTLPLPIDPKFEFEEENESNDGFSDLIEYALDTDSDDSTFSSFPDSSMQRSQVKRKRIVLPKELQGESNSIVYTTHKATEEELKLEELMVEKEMFVCKFCDDPLDTKTYRGLVSHLKEKHPKEKYYICCDIVAPSSTRKLFDHVKWHLNPDHYKCDQCDFIGVNGTELRKHKQCHREKHFVCDSCGERFSAHHFLKEHYERKHEGAKNCTYCESSFTTKASLNIHIRQYHEVDLTHLCHLCGRGFSSGLRLYSHIYDHGGPHGGQRRKKPKAPKVEALPCDKSYFKMPDLMDDGDYIIEEEVVGDEYIETDA